MNEQYYEQGSNGDHPKSFLSGLLTGALIGGVAGAGAMLLLAPQSGKKTRAKIQHKSQDLRDQTAETVEDTVDQVRDKARQITGDVQERAEKLQHRGQDVLDDQTKRVSAAVEEMTK